IPFSHTLTPANSLELPEASEVAAPFISQRPVIVAIAPGLQTASRERLAALTIPVATGSPVSTCTVTEALALLPPEPTDLKLISCPPSCVASGVHQNSPMV